MEIGAVKQAFNNELILLKKNLSQAKTQTINKLTRKAKQLAEKKGPDALREKSKRKAESAVKEVMLMKKIKARDIGQFIVTHTGKLQAYLNRPQVDNDKVCARLLLHKALQEKYKTIRNRFSNIPIKDLFMSRSERLKLKKEENLKKKERSEKRKKKGIVSAEGDWDVEDVNNKSLKKKIPEDPSNSADDDMSDDNQEVCDEGESGSGSDNDDDDLSVDGLVEDESGERFKISFKEKNHSFNEESNNSNNDNEFEGSDDLSNTEKEEITINKPVKKEKKAENKKVEEISAKSKGNKLKLAVSPKKSGEKDIPIKNIESKLKLKEKVSKAKPEKRQKDSTKNKNLQDKIVNKKFKKDVEDLPAFEQKIVDPFFVTATGENYMSVVEPRLPDEIKEVHKQGNRKLRRAVMFGHAPKIKPRQKFGQENSNFNRPNDFNHSDKYNRFEKPNGYTHGNKYEDNNNKFKRKFDDNRAQGFSNKSVDDKPEKLHPSWEAKKKQSGILPFQGKKIVFDES